MVCIHCADGSEETANIFIVHEHSQDLIPRAVKQIFPNTSTLDDLLKTHLGSSTDEDATVTVTVTVMVYLFIANSYLEADIDNNNDGRAAPSTELCHKQRLVKKLSMRNNTAGASFVALAATSWHQSMATMQPSSCQSSDGSGTPGNTLTALVGFKPRRSCAYTKPDSSLIRGNLQYKHEYSDTYALTAELWTVSTLAALAAQGGRTLRKFDLTSAFLVADMDRKLYVEIPCYAVPNSKAIVLKKALYGGRSSGALYSKEITNFLLAQGFKPTSVDETFLRLDSNGSVILLSLYVDDCMCTTNNEALYKESITALQSKYQLSDHGNPDWHLGMKFACDKTLEEGDHHH
jgi:hypothetical protein